MRGRRRDNTISGAGIYGVIVLLGALCVLPLWAADPKPVPPPPTEAIDESVTDAWKACKGRLFRALELHEKKPSLPRKAWLKYDRRDADAELCKILDDVIEVLGFSALTECRAQHEALGEKIRAGRQKLIELGEKRMEAPDDAPMLTRDKEHYDKRITQLKADIAEYESEQEELVDSLQAEYLKIGITLSREQVAFYLSSIAGADIMTLSAVFHNVRQLSLMLERLASESPGNLETVKRYYGLHVVMVRTLSLAHRSVIENINDKYMPRIVELSARNEATAGQTKQLLKQADASQRRTLLANQRTQAMTAEVLELYRQHLADTRERVEKGLVSIEKRYAVAENSYATMQITASLASEISAFVSDVTALQELHLPDMIPIDDKALQLRFSEITAAFK